MADKWSEHVNTDFYGLDGGYNENTEQVEFKSGRKIKYLKNSMPRKTYALNLTVKDTGTAKMDGKTEFEHFLDWYENTVKSGTIPFYLTDIITGNGMRLYTIKVDGWRGQMNKEISLELEEV